MILSSCGGSGNSGNPSSPSSSTVTVAIVGTIGNQAYQPNPVQASSGATVMFKNNDRDTHHIVMDDGSGDSGDITPGATKGFTLKGSGGNFHCTIHNSMVGSINGASAPTPACQDVYCY